MLETAKGLFIFKISLPKKGFAINVLEQLFSEGQILLQEGNKGHRKSYLI